MSIDDNLDKLRDSLCELQNKVYGLEAQLLMNVNDYNKFQKIKGLKHNECPPEFPSILGMKVNVSTAIDEGTVYLFDPSGYIPNPNPYHRGLFLDTHYVKAVITDPGVQA